MDAERLDAERLDAERLDAERLDAERLDAERLDAERLDAERLDAAPYDQAFLPLRRVQCLSFACFPWGNSSPSDAPIPRHLTKAFQLQAHGNRGTRRAVLRLPFCVRCSASAVLCPAVQTSSVQRFHDQNFRVQQYSVEHPASSSFFKESDCEVWRGRRGLALGTGLRETLLKEERQ